MDENFLVSQVLFAAELFFSVKQKAILSNSRVKEVVTARAFVSEFLLEKGLSFSAVGKVLKKEHSTIMYYHNTLMDFKDFQLEYLVFRRFVKNFLAQENYKGFIQIGQGRFINVNVIESLESLQNGRTLVRLISGREYVSEKPLNFLLSLITNQS